MLMYRGYYYDSINYWDGTKKEDCPHTCWHTSMEGAINSILDDDRFEYIQAEFIQPFVAYRNAPPTRWTKDYVRQQLLDNADEDFTSMDLDDLNEDAVTVSTCIWAGGVETNGLRHFVEFGIEASLLIRD